MARLRVLPVTIDTVPTSILVLDGLTMDEADLLAPHGEHELPGIPKILAFPFEVDLPDEKGVTNNVVITSDAARGSDAQAMLRELNAMARTSRST